MKSKGKNLLKWMLCFAILLLCGCSSTASQPSATPTQTPEPTPAPTPEETPEPTPTLPDEVAPDKIGELADARMNFQGISRLYTYYIPSTYQEGDKLPLMITLHGRAFNAEQQLADSQFDKMAEEEGFILIAPNCVTIDNDGNTASEGYTFRDLSGVSANNIRWNAMYSFYDIHGVDDVAYISELIDYFAQHFGIDTDRVYLSGMSNGALMSMRLATELTDKIAGIGAVAGTISYQFMENGVSGPMKIVMINGDEDPTVNIDGAPNYSPSIWEAAEWFNEQFGITGDPVITELPQTVEDDPTQVVKYEWPEKDGSQVVIYLVKGGGHTWPGGTQYFPEARIGKLSRHYSASELIWEELKDFHK